MQDKGRAEILLGRPLRALILEDDPWDAELVVATLRRAATDLKFEVLDSAALFRQRLEEADFEIVLADYNLGGWTAIDALEILRQSGKGIPLVVVTGALGDDAAVECVRQGAADYVLKDRLERLPVAVDRAVRRKAYGDEVARQQEQIRRSKEEWELTFNTVPDPVLLLDDQFHIRYANRATAKLVGVEAEQLIDKSCHEVVHGSSGFHPDCPYERMLATGKEQRADIVDTRHGKVFDGTASPLYDSAGKMRGCVEVLRDITDRRRAEDSHRQLSAQLLRAQDDERRRIALELHDSTAQNLAALAMNLARMNLEAGSLDPQTREILSESIQLADRCMQEIRDFSYLLYPPTLDEHGLASALQWFAEGFARRSGIRVDLDLPDGLRRLPKDAETALFRVVQECLANVQRHSGSPSVRIRIVQEPEALFLEVADEGRGIPPPAQEMGQAASRVGLGLMGMKERMRHLGGHFEIKSGSLGSTIRVSLPLREAA
jgi:two-component system sensor histidine kinase UhpB